MATGDTRLRLLDAAERLFAEQGFGATSLRAVTSEAGVNIAAVNYHFGSKEALIGAVFARRLEPLNGERRELLERAIDAAPAGCPSVEAVLESLIRPAVDRLGARGGQPSLISGLLGRAHNEQDEQIRALVFEQFESTTRLYCEVLARILPHLDEAELFTRFHFVIGAMASALMDPGRVGEISGGVVDATDMDGIATRLVAFLAAGLNAPAAKLDREAVRARAAK